MAPGDVRGASPSFGFARKTNEKTGPETNPVRYGGLSLEFFWEALMRRTLLALALFFSFVSAGAAETVTYVLQTPGVV